MDFKRISNVVLAATLFLLIPLIATHTVEGFNWDLFDFIIIWILLVGAGLTYVFVASRSRNLAYKAATGLAVFFTLILIWINGAVGIIGSEDNPMNLLYGGVLMVGILGTALARFKPRGMSYALLSMAIAQFLVPVIAFALNRPDMSPGVIQVFMLNAFFVLAFVISGLLFRRATT